MFVSLFVSFFVSLFVCLFELQSTVVDDDAIGRVTITCRVLEPGAAGYAPCRSFGSGLVRPRAASDCRLRLVAAPGNTQRSVRAAVQDMVSSVHLLTAHNGAHQTHKHSTARRRRFVLIRFFAFRLSCCNGRSLVAT